jgi:hypothetical protein
LNAKYESVRSGEELDETFGVMARMDEGFNYNVEVTEQTRDQVLDYLDENQVEYQASSPLTYRIECQDREAAYRTGRALSKILSKKAVRDSIEVEEMADKSKSREKAAKEKLGNLKPRNAIAVAAITKTGAGPHKADPRKDDKFGRGAKHKGKRFDESEIDDFNDVRIDEGVIAVKEMNPLFRLRELAGLPTGEDDFAGIEIADAPALDPNGVLASGPVTGGEAGDETVDDVAADVDMDADLDAPVDMGDDMVGDELGGELDADAGVPGAIGSDPIEAIPAIAPEQSEAMMMIEDDLNAIQAKLPEIRISEYKSLVQKLLNITNQVQMMGRDYLGERRKK